MGNIATALPIRETTSNESTDRRKKYKMSCMPMSIHIYVVSGSHRVGNVLCICMIIALTQIETEYSNIQPLPILAKDNVVFNNISFLRPTDLPLHLTTKTPDRFTVRNIRQ